MSPTLGEFIGGLVLGVVAVAVQAGALYLLCRAIWIARPAIEDGKGNNVDGRRVFLHCVGVVTLTLAAMYMFAWLLWMTSRITHHFVDG